MIERIASVIRLSRVPVPHTNDAHYVVDSQGRRWVSKREEDMGCEALLAEALTWLLAQFVGAPTPAAAFCDDMRHRAWLSAWVMDARHWSDAPTSNICNAREAAAILALDAVVMNEARHGRNILLTPHPSSCATVWAIDADEALVGHPDDLIARGLTPPSPYLLARGFPPAGWEESALEAAARFATISSARLLGFVQEACDIAREDSVQAVFQAIQARCAAAVSLTTQYIARIELRP